MTVPSTTFDNNSGELWHKLALGALWISTMLPTMANSDPIAVAPY